MRTLAPLLFLALAGCDATRPAPATNTTPAPAPVSTPAATPTTTTETAMPPATPATIEQSVIDQAMEEGGGLFVVKVTKAAVDQSGTRSESARIEAEVVRTIRGTAGARVSLRSYTSGGNTVLTPGSMYVVATFADKRFAPALDLLGYAATSEAQLEASVKLHQAMTESKPK